MEMSEVGVLAIWVLAIASWFGVVYILSIIDCREKLRLIKEIRERK